MKFTLPILFALLVIASCKKTTPTPDPVPPTPTDTMPTALKKGLIAYYPFNGNANDESGNGLHGTAVGNVTYGSDRFGASAKSLQLNGDNGFIKVDDNAKLRLTKTMTIAFQFYPETDAPYSLIGKRERGAGYQDWHIMSNYNGRPTVFANIKKGLCNTSNADADWSNVYSHPDSAVIVKGWNCLVATFDGTTKKIYLNGNLVANETVSFNELAACAGTEMRMGYWWDSAPFSFKGKMDEVRIYNRVLSADERAQLCTAADFTDPLAASLKNGLVAYYPFTGNLNDQSGNGFNGTAVGNVSFGADRTGAASRALHLNGDNGYVTVADNPKLDITQRMTVALQFYPETTTAYSLVGKSLVTGGQNAFHLMGNYFAPAVFAVIKDGSCRSSNTIDDWSNAFSDNSPTIKANTWNCFVAIFDGASQKIYLNGVKVADMAVNFTAMGGCANTDLRFGYWWNGDPYSYKGSLDEIRIYNRVLTNDEIARLCTAQ